MRERVREFHDEWGTAEQQEADSDTLDKLRNSFVRIRASLDYLLAPNEHEAYRYLNAEVARLLASADGTGDQLCPERAQVYYDWYCFNTQRIPETLRHSLTAALDGFRAVISLIIKNNPSHLSSEALGDLKLSLELFQQVICYLHPKNFPISPASLPELQAKLSRLHGRLVPSDSTRMIWARWDVISDGLPTLYGAFGNIFLIFRSPLFLRVEKL